MSATQQIAVSLQRTWEGLKVHVKLNPRIEEYFRERAEGSLSPVSLAGRFWRTKEPLNVYNLSPELSGSRNILRAEHYVEYRMDRPGERLVLGTGTVNLSFLRLQGASSDEGAGFVIPGVFDEDTIVNLNHGIETAAETFYRSFLKPVKLTSIISTIEREGGSGEFQEVRPSN